MQAHHLNTNQHGPADLYSRVLYSIPPKWVNLPITVLRTCLWSTVLAKTHRIQISHCGGSRSVSQSERLTAPRAHKLLSPRDWHLGAILPAPNAQSRCCTKSGSWHLRRQPSQYVQNWSCYLFFLRGFGVSANTRGLITGICGVDGGVKSRDADVLPRSKSRRYNVTFGMTVQLHLKCQRQ